MIDPMRGYRATEVARILAVSVRKVELWRRSVVRRVTPHYRHRVPPCYFVGRADARFPGAALIAYQEGKVRNFVMRQWLEQLIDPARLYEESEAAELLSVSTRSLREWANQVEHASAPYETDGCGPGPQHVVLDSRRMYPGASLIAYALREEAHVLLVRDRTRVLTRHVQRWGYARRDIGERLSTAKFVELGGWTCGVNELRNLVSMPGIVPYAQTHDGWCSIQLTFGGEQ